MGNFPPSTPARRVDTQYPELMRFRVADITIRVAAAPGMRFSVDEATGRFLVEEGEPVMSIMSAWSDNSRWSGRDQIFDSGSLWRMYRDGDYFIFSFTSRPTGPVPYKLARINRDFTAGEIRFHEPYYKGCGGVHPLEYPLDELLVTHYLAGGRGVEVHACGLITPDGQGYLFAGQSGAGKTTLACLWRGGTGATILSDDRIVLRTERGGIWMHGTPWHGEGGMASPAKSPLKRIFLLRQGRANSLVPQRPADAAARLLACSFPPYYSHRAMELALGFLDQAVQSVPCDELIFTPDERAVRCVEGIGA